MSKKLKKTTVLLLVIMMSLVTLIACHGCVDPNPDDGNKTGGAIITPLADLVDYASATHYHTVSKVTYATAKKDKAIGDLAKKQVEESVKELDADKAIWEEDTTTFTKIFVYSDPAKIVDSFARAALEEDRMVKLVEYIVRPRISQKYNYNEGTGGAIQDYEELDELYDLYDADENDKIGETKVYELLQLKRRKVIGELVTVFGNEGAQAARTAMEVLCYAQEVVWNEMIPVYNGANGTSYDFDEYFKEIFFDYETLVYFYAFNQTISDGAASKVVKDVAGYVSVAPIVKKDIVKLYGYYYQYEKKDYSVFTLAEYREYLTLSQKEYFQTDSEALKYTEYDRRHYREAYRYGEKFYEDYYKTHFAFQEKQEYFDREIYGILYALAATGSKATYSSQMLEAIANKRLGANLKVSDVNYEYTGVNANVIEYNKKHSAYFKLPEAVRDNIESDDKTSLGNVKYEITYVEYQVASLNSQLYTLEHKTIASSGKGGTMSLALEYQIYSFSADYIRSIQAYRKDNVILAKEIERELKKPEIDNDSRIILEKKDQIGRNTIMITNISSNYDTAGITSQLNQAQNVIWSDITKNVKDTTTKNYKAYNEELLDGQPRYTVNAADQVKKLFEETLIRRVWDGTNAINKDAPDDQKSEATGWEKKYDTNHALSRLLNTHETVLRHANGQVKISYMNMTDAGYREYVVDNISTDYKNSSALYINKADPWNLEYAYDGRGAKPNEVTMPPKSTSYTVTFKKETIDNSKAPTLAYYPSSTQNKWNDANYVLTTKSLDKTENNVSYTYTYQFAGWFLDPGFEYIAIPGETYDFDVKLYPAFYVTKVKK